LQDASGLAAKRDVQLAARHFQSLPVLPGLPGSPHCSVPNGDDTAALPDAAGHLLLAAEGMLPEFVAQDPWFGGFCSIMVNVSDVTSMGGTPIAAVDVVFAGDKADNPRILEGMRAAADAYGVPIVGGHTGRAPDQAIVCVAILGRARKLITSFAARPGDDLLLAVDLRGSYRGRGNNFNAATCASSVQLRSQHALLSELAEAGLVHAGKDVSMAGIPGTLAMLCEASGCGARLDLGQLPIPPNVTLERWLLSFPSYGFLLATRASHSAAVASSFRERGVACARVGEFQRVPVVELRQGSERAAYLDLATTPLTGFRGYAQHWTARETPAEGTCP
ncbi:MAG TPA: sll0787 family AIR synthase-like protein, partial [Polyangiaceae bacterium]